MAPRIHLGTSTLTTKEDSPDLSLNHPDTIKAGGPAGPVQPGQAPLRDSPRTRDFEFTYTPTASVRGPMGPMNVGYVHNVVSTNGQWVRGDIPDMGYGFGFALRRPRFMREPRTDLGTYNLAQG